MSPLNLASILLVIASFSCSQTSKKLPIDAKAINLNYSAMALVPFIENTDSANKAILLLDRATAIDHNYFLGYQNKLIFYYQLKQYDKAIFTVNKLIQLQPSAHDLYLTGGLLYEFTSDTVSSDIYFNKSLGICNSVLDTMKNNNSDYEMFIANKAINLIMLEEKEKANFFLKQFHDGLAADKNSDNEIRNWIYSLINKDKKQVMAALINQAKN